MKAKQIKNQIKIKGERMSNIQKNLLEFLAKRDRAKQGYKIFLNGTQLKTEEPLMTEEEVMGALYIALSEPTFRPVIMVEDPLGCVVANLDTNLTYEKVVDHSHCDCEDEDYEDEDEE